jgi:hypothetical protein
MASTPQVDMQQLSNAGTDWGSVFECSVTAQFSNAPTV